MKGISFGGVLLTVLVVIAVACWVDVVLRVPVFAPSPTYREDCTEDKDRYERVFMECLSKVPKGPDTIAASGNDWDEVVQECRSTAYMIAHECKRTCVKNCE